VSTIFGIDLPHLFGYDRQFKEYRWDADETSLPEPMIKLIDQLGTHHKLVVTFLIGLSLIILAFDCVYGPQIRFPILFIIPIWFASWYLSKEFGIALAIILPLIRFGFNVFREIDITLLESAINAVLRIITFVLIVYLTHYAMQAQSLRKRVQRLEGILPICSFCKRIRVDDNEWVILEQYITTHSEAQFSHGLCPDCARRHYSEYLTKPNAS
jgi:hypothetical protein